MSGTATPGPSAPPPTALPPAASRKQENDWKRKAIQRVSQAAAAKFKEHPGQAMYFEVPLEDTDGVFSDGDVGNGPGTACELLDAVAAGSQAGLDKAVKKDPMRQRDMALDLKLRVELDLGREILHVRGVPSRAQNGLVRIVCGDIIDQMLLKSPLGDTMMGTGSPYFNLPSLQGKLRGKVPDVGLSHLRTPPTSLPAFIVVAGFAETLEQLRLEAQAWFTVPSTLAVLLAWYEPSQASESEDAFAQQPTICLQLQEQDLTKGGDESSVHVVLAWEDEHPDGTMRWTRGSTTAPTLKFRYRHFVSNADHLPPNTVMDDVLSTDSVSVNLLWRLEKAADYWRRGRAPLPVLT